MTTSGCPPFRRGATKAAMQLRAAEGQLEPRVESAPVEATDLRDLALKLTEKALRVLEQDLDEGDPRARQEAARALAAVGMKVMDQPPPPAAPLLTGEERIEAIVAALVAPDAEMAEAMKRAGERRQQ